ncbi:hypothetical protein [Xanthomonas vasicola]|uniref:hypothetical protein n=2 Tax=Xanthomonas vasicola TaxID=56459 RepID=UPI0018EFD6CA|nr:hypothetical protein [Xanthomonas vasicola]
MALQKGQRLREVGQFEVAEVGQIKSAGDRGVQGALGSATAATAAPMLNELTKNLPDGVREAVGAGLAAGLGAVTGGAAGAGTAFNADTNNRQLHPSEVKFLKSDEVVEKYIDYMAENGLVLTEQEARVRLDRFAASKEDENWAALNGTDALTETFLVKDSEGRYYTDSMGDRHAFFQSTDKERKDPTVNLNSLYGSRFDPSIKNYFDDIRSPDHAENQKNQELQYLGKKLGYDAADKQANFGGDLTSIGKGMLLGIGSIAFSGYSDQIGPLDELALKNNYQLLLKDQGRWAEAGYVEGLDWATTQRQMWAGIVVGEAGGLVGSQFTNIIRNSIKNTGLESETLSTRVSVASADADSEAGARPVVRSNGEANIANGAELRSDLANKELSSIANQDVRLKEAMAGSGTSNQNFGIGTANAQEAHWLGMTWVGDGTRPLSDGSGWISADGTRAYRSPAAKPNSEEAVTGTQANFERYEIDSKGKRRKISNGHLDITTD